MHPVLFHLPGTEFPIRAFGVTVACGFLLGLWFWGRLLRRFGEDPQGDPERASQVALWLFVGVIGGARLMYAAVEAGQYLAEDVTPVMERYLETGIVTRAPAGEEEAYAAQIERARRVAVGHDFLTDPIQIVMVHKGGLVMFGGFFGAVLLGTWAANRRKLNPLNALDTGLLAGFVGQTVGRWG